MSPWGASSLLNLLTYFPEKAQRVSKRVETASRRFKFTRQGGFSMDRRAFGWGARAPRALGAAQTGARVFGRTLTGSRDTGCSSAGDAPGPRGAPLGVRSVHRARADQLQCSMSAATAARYQPCAHAAAVIRTAATATVAAAAE